MLEWTIQYLNLLLSLGSICSTWAIFGTGHLALDPGSVVGNSAVNSVVPVLGVNIVHGVRDNGDTCSHQSTAVAVADLADEDVLAVALLVGQGAAAVALVTYFFRLFFINIREYCCRA